MTTAAAANQPDNVALLGFGEAGAAFANGWHAEFPELIIKAYDLKTDSKAPFVAAKKWQEFAAFGVKGGKTPRDTLTGATVVFSLVTADKAFDVARTAAEYMSKNVLFFDCNSCAPDTKRASASVLEAAGICYVDTAVMAPVHPNLHHVPLLVSGPHIAKAIEMLGNLGMKAKPVAGDIGMASSVKMMRSVMIKGLEALTLECFLAARKAGIEDEVLASLDGSFPGWNWGDRAAYNFERSISHGKRRAEEMHEVAKTVASLGLCNGMSLATAGWQQRVGDLDISATETELKTKADAILCALGASKAKGNP